MKLFTLLLLGIFAMAVLSFELQGFIGDMTESTKQVSTIVATITNAGIAQFAQATAIIAISTIMMPQVAVGSPPRTLCVINFGPERCCAAVVLANCSDYDLAHKCTFQCQLTGDAINSRAISTFDPISVLLIISEVLGAATTSVVTPTSFLTITQASSSIPAAGPFTPSLISSTVSFVATHQDSSTITLVSMTTASILASSVHDIQSTSPITGSSSSPTPSTSETRKALSVSANSMGSEKISRTQKQPPRPSIVAGITFGALAIVGLVAVLGLCLRRCQLRMNEERVSYMLPLSSRETINTPASNSRKPVFKKGMKISAPIRVQKKNDNGQWEDGIGDMKTQSINLTNFRRSS